MAKPIHRYMRSLLLSGLWLTAFASVQSFADTQAQIVSTDLRSTLASNEAFNVRLKYNSSERVALWVQPYFRGKPIKGALVAASSQYVGAGEMVTWFALKEAGKVDEVRIMVGGGDPWRRWDIARQSIDLEWTNEVAGDGTAAPGADEPAASDDESSDGRVVRADEP